MLQVMLDSGNPNVVAAAQRNIDGPAGEDLHPAYCGVQLTNLEAHVMERDLTWLPMDMS